MSKDKITVFEGDGVKNINAETIRKIKKDLPMMLEYQLVAAELARDKYTALINQGFTEAQALELTKTIF